MPSSSTLTRAAASATGAVLAGLVHLLSVARRPRKPMHPDGRVRRGRMVRHGASTGIAFLDDVGEHDVVVRESNGIGLPRGWPDLRGLAVRLAGEGDLLLSTTGHGRWTRFLLTLTRGHDAARLGTLFPYATALGPVLLAARYRSPSLVELAWAVGGGRWHHFADLHLGEREPDDPALVFDAVLHTPPGLEQYDVVRRLRAASYRTARESRGERLRT